MWSLPVRIVITAREAEQPKKLICACCISQKNRLHRPCTFSAVIWPRIANGSPTSQGGKALYVEDHKIFSQFDRAIKHFTGFKDQRLRVKTSSGIMDQIQRLRPSLGADAARLASRGVSLRQPGGFVD